MSSSKLDEFLRTKSNQQAPEPVDWDAKTVSWQLALNGLYTQLESYLGNLITEGVLKTSRRPVTVQEDFIGSY